MYKKHVTIKNFIPSADESSINPYVKHNKKFGSKLLKYPENII